jgi:hypothetical protein
MDDDGTVFVFGGARRLTSSDIPLSSSGDSLQPVVRSNTTAKVKPAFPSP